MAAATTTNDCLISVVASLNKMEETIARLLNVSTAADKTKLNALIIEYLDNAEDSDAECDNGDGEEALDDDDAAEYDMAATDSEIVLERAASMDDALSESEDDELKKATGFR